MATATSTFASYDRSVPASSVNFRTAHDPRLFRQDRGFFTTDTNPVAPRFTRSIDDMDILTLQRHYDNIDLFEQSTLSNSAEDVSPVDRIPYEFEVFDQDQNDSDDYDIPYMDGNGIDYNIAIQERLKKANEEFEHDRTSSDVKHQQHVSFDAVVKALDIVQDPSEYDNTNSLIRPSVLSITEEPSTIVTSPRNENGTHEYTVPLNDTQPKEGPTLVQQIKALQCHGTLPTNDRWTTTANKDSSSNREDDLSIPSFKSNETNIDTQDMSNSSSSKNSMIVSVSGRFDLQDEDDYTAKHHLKSNDNGNQILFLPAPPIEPKQKQDPPHRPFPSRPKSSSDKKNKIETTIRQRPESAGVSKTVESFVERPSAGVDFNELLRKAAEKKRAELREERRKKEEEEEKRRQELAKAKESYDRWLQEKDTERKRINEDKRLEKQEHQARQIEQEKELSELRENKFQKWLERKANDAMIVNEFRKLRADEDGMQSGESTFSLNNTNQNSNHRAFQRWLRRKYEQSMEKKRQLRLESKCQRQRHRQRRSLKRHQLQQDLQLAKSFGYS